MARPLAITAVVATRNREDQIPTVLESLLAVEYDPFEIVIVDQSTNGLTRGAVEALAGGDARIRYEASDEVGVSRARNLGAALARGDIVAYTDDDCAVGPGWMEALAEEFQSSDVSGVFGRVLPLERRARDGAEIAFKDGGEPCQYEGRAIPWHIGHGANMAFRRRDLLEAGGFDVMMGPGAPMPSHEDCDVSYRLLVAGRRLRYSPRALVYHRHWKDWSAQQHAERAYGLGAGGQFTKCLRCGDAYGMRLLAAWVWQLGVRRLGAGLLKWRSRKVMYLGYCQLVYPWIGIWRSFRYRVDRQSRTYAAD
ncbi:MAG: glycosyltransferase [Candidatus Dormibacteraceae bacterium]